MTEFNRWLEEEMKVRDWSISDLARIAHVARGSIGNVLRGEREPGIDLCNAIAKAFRIPPEVVFQKAGLLQPVASMDDKSKEIIHLYQMMNEENQEDLAAYARMKLTQQEKKEGKNKRPPTRPGAG